MSVAWHSEYLTEAIVSLKTLCQPGNCARELKDWKGHKKRNGSVIHMGILLKNSELKVKEI